MSKEQLDCKKNHPPITRSRILRLPQVVERVGLCRSTIYSSISKGEFPRQIKLGERSTGWLECEVQAWIEKRVIESQQDGVNDFGGECYEA